MNPHLQKLVQIAGKKQRTILGLMSGTSLDGLDLALCSVTGHGRDTAFTLNQFESVPYTADVRQNLLHITSSDRIDTEQLCIWHTFLAHVHAGMILAACSRWDVQPGDIDLIASHGHTLYHAPKSWHGKPDKPNSTLQIGDGDHLAVKTGVITLSDFRQKDTALGGEGAPLAAYGDYLLFSHPSEDRVMLNLGGIANFTWLPASKTDFPPLSMDTGPANTLIDAAMRRYFNGRHFDENGAVSARGKVSQKVLDRLKSHSWFDLPHPKTTGPELFSLKLLDEALSYCRLEDLSPEDIIATLTELTADSVSEAICRIVQDAGQCGIYVSGGGLKNETLMKRLAEKLGKKELKSSAGLGVDPAAKEAVIFAVLANEGVCGNGDLPSLGKVSFP